MRMVTWDDERVSTRQSVAARSAFSGAELRDRYLQAVRAFTLSLTSLRGNSIYFGPIELLRFGSPRVTKHAVDWPIQGGLLTGQSGGHWRVEAASGRIEATVSGYAPRLPRPIYTWTHLQVHLLFTRLFLLGMRGREPAPGVRASPRDRLAAAGVDVAFCLTLGRMTGRRRFKGTLAIAIAYHVACWSLGGRTLGGLVMRQRVVAVDGTRLTPTQSLLRLAVLPLAWATRRPVHDEVAYTDVIRDENATEKEKGRLEPPLE